MLKMNALTTIKNLAIISSSTALITLGIHTSAMAAVFYDLIDLSTVSGRDFNFNALDINDAGQVVGESGGRALLWNQRTGITDLSSFSNGDFNYSRAVAINNSGQVVLATDQGAFLWKSSTGLINLNDLIYAGETYYGGSTPYDINDIGQVVGELDIYRAFFWSFSTGSITINRPNTYDLAYRINNLGQVVGASGDPETGSTSGFLWSRENSLTEFSILPDGTATLPTGINNTNQIIAFAETNFKRRALLWSEETDTIDLGFLPGDDSASPEDINDLGHIVGYSYNSNGDVFETRDAFLWSPNKGLIDLNTLIDPNLGWKLTTATVINNQGQIIGIGFKNGEFISRSFLLTPRSNAEPVPEPITMGGTLLAGVGLAYLRRQRQLRSSKVTG